MGTAQLGAHQVALQLWEFSALVLDSFAIAAQSLVGAALGAMTWPPRAASVGRPRGSGCSPASPSALVLLGLAGVLPDAFTSSTAVRHQLHLLWPWFVGMQPFGGVVFALDGVLIGAGDVAFLRTITLIAALGVFVPINLGALYWHWGIGGVWAGL